jgi:hypothetical protein
MRTRPRRAMYPLTALLGLLVSECQALADPGVGVGPFKSRPLPHIFYLIYKQGCAVSPLPVTRGCRPPANPLTPFASKWAAGDGGGGPAWGVLPPARDLGGGAPPATFPFFDANAMIVETMGRLREMNRLHPVLCAVVVVESGCLVLGEAHTFSHAGFQRNTGRRRRRGLPPFAG